MIQVAIFGTEFDLKKRILAEADLIHNSYAMNLLYSWQLHDLYRYLQFTIVSPSPKRRRGKRVRMFRRRCWRNEFLPRMALAMVLTITLPFTEFSWEDRLDLPGCTQRTSLWRWKACWRERFLRILYRIHRFKTTKFVRVLLDDGEGFVYDPYPKNCCVFCCVFNIWFAMVASRGQACIS